MVKLLEMTADGLMEKHRGGVPICIVGPIVEDERDDGVRYVFCGTIGNGEDRRGYQACLKGEEFGRFSKYFQIITKEDK